MPRIFDNIELPLLPAFRDTIKLSYRADFCVGYFNLRGWRRIGDLIEAYIGNQGACCRLLVGMQSLPADRTRSYFPDRIPKTIKFSSETSATNSPLDFEEIVEVINALNLPRYGLGNYIAKKPKQKPTEAEQRQLNALFRGGRRLMGFYADKPV